MPWLVCHSRRYFYRSVTRNGRVEKIYVGRGKAAEDALAEIQRNRAKREELFKLTHDEVNRHCQMSGPLARLCQSATLLLNATLVTAGFHQHDGAWRLRRNVHRRTTQQ